MRNQQNKNQGHTNNIFGKHHNTSHNKSSHNHSKTPNKKNSCMKIFVQFYKEEFFEMINTFNRSQFVSVMLLSLQYLQLVALLFDSESEQKIDNDDSLMKLICQVLQQFRGGSTILSALIDDDDNTFQIKHYEWIVILSFSFNILLVLFTLFISIFHQHINNNNNKNNKNNNNNNNNSNYFTYWIHLYVSIMLKQYPYAFHLIILVSDFTTLLSATTSYPLFIISMVDSLLSIVLCNIAIFHDFTFSFRSKDCLSRQDGLIWNAFYLQEIVISFLTSYEVSGVEYFIVCILIEKVIYSAWYFPYHRDFIQKLNIFYSLVSLLLWASKEALEINYLSSEMNVHAGIVVVCIVPLVWQCSIYFYNQRKKHIFIKGYQTFAVAVLAAADGKKNIKEESKGNEYLLDLFCRQLSDFIDLDIYDYLKEAKGMSIDQIFTYHICHCIKQKCFCQEFINDNPSTHSTLFDKEKRNNFLFLLISQMQIFILLHLFIHKYYIN